MWWGSCHFIIESWGEVKIQFIGNLHVHVSCDGGRVNVLIRCNCLYIVLFCFDTDVPWEWGSQLKVLIVFLCGKHLKKLWGLMYRDKIIIWIAASKVYFSFVFAELLGFIDIVKYKNERKFMHLHLVNLDKIKEKMKRNSLWYTCILRVQTS